MIDKLLAKDVGKGKLTDVEAKEAREKIRVVDSMDGLRDVDMVIEVRHLCRNCEDLIDSVWYFTNT